MESFLSRRRTRRSPIFPIDALLIAILAAALSSARTVSAAAPSPSQSPGAAATPVQRAAAAPSAVSSPVQPVVGEPEKVSPQDVINYLSDTISWFRHLAVEAQLVHQPEEAIFYTNDHQMATETLSLAFQYARAQADLLAKVTGMTPMARPARSAPNEAPSPAISIAMVQQRAASAAADLRAAQDHVQRLQAALASAPRKSRAALASQLDGAKSEVQLAQARVDALAMFLQFAAGTARVVGDGATLNSQIDELEASVPTGAHPQAKSEMRVAPMAAQGGTQPAGLFGDAASYFALEAKSQTLSDTVALTAELLARVDRMRAPLIKTITGIDARGIALARESGTGSLAELSARKAEYQRLIDLHKLASAALLPLSKQSLVLGLYRDNLLRWQDTVERRASAQLRNLAMRLGGLFATLAAIGGAAVLWRLFTMRYIADPTRRHRAMQVRRIALWTVVALVVLFDFANEIGSIATVLGFAAAGIALALQNVILSVAGFFFLIGRYGIKAGDRVTVAGVTGDVIDIGLVKLSLLELSPKDQLPTGRVVVFSNAVVFQPSGNFSKQAPGFSFVWNELHLMLSPDCDYRLAEKLVLDAIDQVYARYRDQMQREHRHLGSELRNMLEAPRPQSRLMLTPAGLQMTVRYPAEMRIANQIGDEVSRRVLDAVQREPALKLVAQAQANIQPVAPPASADGEPEAQSPDASIAAPAAAVKP
jgi:small-conductance mechanosensitive channel